MTLIGLSQSARTLYANVIDDRLFGHTTHEPQAVVDELEQAGLIWTETLADGRTVLHPTRHGLNQHIDAQDGSTT